MVIWFFSLNFVTDLFLLRPFLMFNCPCLKYHASKKKSLKRSVSFMSYYGLWLLWLIPLGFFLNGHFPVWNPNKSFWKSPTLLNMIFVIAFADKWIAFWLCYFLNFSASISQWTFCVSHVAQRYGALKWCSFFALFYKGKFVFFLLNSRLFTLRADTSGRFLYNFCMEFSPDLNISVKYQPFSVTPTIRYLV